MLGKMWNGDIFSLVGLEKNKLEFRTPKAGRTWEFNILLFWKVVNNKDTFFFFFNLWFPHEQYIMKTK